MSRYVTPSKIVLLALISLYTESVIPAAASIPILSFIFSSILPQSKKPGSRPSLDSSSIISIETFQTATITHGSFIPGRTVWDLLLKKLWEINTLDALEDFFDSLSSLRRKTREELRRDAENGILEEPDRILLSRTSPFGTFVRRVHLEHIRLQFEDCVILWKSFIKFREATFSNWKRRNPTAVRTSFDANLVDFDLGVDHNATNILYGDLGDEKCKDANFSFTDVENFLEFQIDQMQKTGNRLPNEMKTQFEEMIKTGSNIPSRSHYVKFLDAWKAGDYPSSFDCLHRYFDYTMQHKDRTNYHYALLTLAILQADFGCHAEAVAAILEAIATARENKDTQCLTYSLSWLSNFSKTHPEEAGDIRNSGMLSTEKEALGVLKVKAKEASMWSLLGICLLSEARLGLTTGDSVAIAFENITKASYLTVIRNVSNNTGSQLSIQSTIFSRLGISYLGWSYAEIFRQCYLEVSSAEDRLYCICNCAIALAHKGRYNDALALIDKVKPTTMRTLKYQQDWISYSGLLKLQRKLHRNDLVAAEHFLSQLQANRPSSPISKLTVTIEEIHLQIRRQDYSNAMELLETCASDPANEEADILLRIKLLTLKARIFYKAGIPQKGFSVAVRAVNMAYKARIQPALWEAIGAVSRVLLSLKEFDAAARLLVSIMPQVLECEDCELTAESYLSLADAHMGMAGQAKSEPLKRKEQMAKALEYIDRSFDEFSRIEDVRGQCEMLAKKATIMRLNGDFVLANDYAAKYLDIEKAAREERL